MTEQAVATQLADSAPETAALPYADAIPGAVLAADEFGIVVDRDKLIDFTLHLRNNEGFEYLSSLTATDYLGFEGRTAADRFEVVYHLFDIDKGRRWHRAQSQAPGR